MEHAIETFSLTKVFSDWWGRDKVCAVQDLNLKVRYNEVFGLLGPNGSGKTTTLKMLLGLLYPTKGKAAVLGGDSADPKVSERIGFLPEESYLYRYLTARETLDFYGRLFGLNRQARKMRIEALLDMVGLRTVAARPVGTFSKGMARRIGLAQALINDPELLILDEPTTGLDPIGTRQIKDLILELAKRGKTILLCSHLLADVEDVCDRIAILYGGRVQSEGEVRKLLVQTEKRQITTGRISEGAVEQIRQIVESEDSEFDVSTPLEKLETYFIKTVAAAEEHAVPTSGAVGSGQISQFLRPEAPVESILDKLVSANVSDSADSERLATKPAGGGASDGTAEPDGKLLQELTGRAASAELKGVVRKQEQQPEAVGATDSEQDRSGADILQELTGRSEDKQPDEKQESKSGGNGNDG